MSRRPPDHLPPRLQKLKNATLQMNSNGKTPIVGIDLGTTFSALAALDETGRPQIVPVDGERIMPSCVWAPKESPDKLIVGNEARNNLPIEPDCIVSRFKRAMGTEQVYTLGSGATVTPLAASAAVLRKLTQEASKTIGLISKVIITVPANFAERQRRATIEAGRMANLEVLNIINEPTAAVLAYATQQPVDGTVLIYDLGGGTLDVTIAKVQGHDVECLTSKGDPDLGGIDFDQAIANLIDARHEEVHGRSLREALGITSPEDERCSPEWQALLLEAERIKKTLTTHQTARFRFRDSPDGLLQGELTRDTFEEAISALISKAEMCVETALEDIALEPGQIDHVLLVGGSTRVPAVRASLKRIFGREPAESVNPDEAVALGAAIYAGLRAAPESLTALQRERLERVRLQDVANHYYGTLALEDDPNTGQRVKRVTILIPKNAPLPCAKTHRFYTVQDGQRYVDCSVTQSSEEEYDPDFVDVILQEELGPLPANRPAGRPIDVTYRYDLDQTMHVEFKDVESGMVFHKQLSLSGSDGGSLTIPDLTIE